MASPSSGFFGGSASSGLFSGSAGANPFLMPKKSGLFNSTTPSSLFNPLNISSSGQPDESETTEPPAEPAADHRPVLLRLEKLLSSGEYSDLQITCGEATWNVHRMIVCSASDFLKDCCVNIEGAQASVIDLPDAKQHTVDALMRYLYTANYDDKIAVAETVPILFNVQVHTIADKYKVPDLCKLAEAKFVKRAEVEWETDGFAQAVLEMYETSSPSKKTMQDSAVKLAVEHASNLFQDGQSKFQEIAQKVAPFAYGVSLQLMAAHLDKQKQESEGFRTCLQCKAMVKPLRQELFGASRTTCPQCGSSMD